MAIRQGALATAVPASHNEKLGRAATTHAAQQSCPSDCVFRDGGGCYAETGAQGKFVTMPLNESASEQGATAFDVAVAEAAAIDSMEIEPSAPMRLHTVGDCATNVAATIVAASARRYNERGGGVVWTYTHAWRTVERKSWGNVSVLASCETPEDVALAHERGYATALVVERFESEKLYEIGSRAEASQARQEAPARGARGESGENPEVPQLAAGLSPATRVLPCPAQTRHRTCSDCRLCFDAPRLLASGLTIGFEIHGLNVTKRAARQSLRNPGDPMIRLPSEERIRQIRNRYLAEHGREPATAEVVDEITDLSPSSIYEWLRYLRGEIIHPKERRRIARERTRREPRLDSVA